MDLSSSSESMSADLMNAATEAVRGTANADPQAASKGPESQRVAPIIYPVEVDHGRDSLLTDFGKETLKDRYLLPGES